MNINTKHSIIFLIQKLVKDNQVISEGDCGLCVSEKSITNSNIINNTFPKLLQLLNIH